MFTYKKIEKSFPSDRCDHYIINFEDGSTIIYCTPGQLLPIGGSYEKNIKSTNKYVFECVKQIEICHILKNIFNVKEIECDECCTITPCIEFDDEFIIEYIDSQYEYCSNVISSTSINDKIFTNMYDLLDFLREKYQHLLKPVKLAINSE